MIKEAVKILVVDDYDMMRDFIRGTLAAVGFSNVTEACDGDEAFRLLIDHANKGESFSFVLSDWNMPNINGMELLKKCRTHEKIRDIPYMFVTSEDDVNKMLEASRYGVMDYLVKPFAPEILKEKLEMWFESLVKKTTGASAESDREMSI